MVGINVPIPVPVAYYSLRRLEGLAVRRHAHVRPRGRHVLHPRQGRHVALARSRRVHGGINLGFPQNPLESGRLEKHDDLRHDFAQRAGPLHCQGRGGPTPTNSGPSSHVFHSWSAQAHDRRRLTIERVRGLSTSGTVRRQQAISTSPRQLVFTSTSAISTRKLVAAIAGAGGASCARSQPSARQRRPLVKPPD